MERGAENMTGKFLEVVVPVAAYQDVARAASRHAARRGIEGKRIVLLPSEKSSSPPFIDVLARRMSAETRAKRVFTRAADWPFFHPQRAIAIAPEIDKVARECDLMISGVAY
jgi:hypothetical protein